VFYFLKFYPISKDGNVVELKINLKIALTVIKLGLTTENLA